MTYSHGPELISFYRMSYGAYGLKVYGLRVVCAEKGWAEVHSLGSLAGRILRPVYYVEYRPTDPTVEIQDIKNHGDPTLYLLEAELKDATRAQLREP